MVYHETTAATANYEPQVVPGLLQTESYIRALTAARWPEWNLDRAVQIRMDRQPMWRSMCFQHQPACTPCTAVASGCSNTNSINPLVHIDSHFGGFFVDDKSYVASYRQLIPAISEVALNEGESREFLADLANEYERASAVTDVEDEQV